jgi:hypothetical protein
MNNVAIEGCSSIIILEAFYIHALLDFKLIRIGKSKSVKESRLGQVEATVTKTRLYSEGGESGDELQRRFEGLRFHPSISFAETV